MVITRSQKKSASSRWSRRSEVIRSQGGPIWKRDGEWTCRACQPGEGLAWKPIRYLSHHVKTEKHRLAEARFKAPRTELANPATEQAPTSPQCLQEDVSSRWDMWTDQQIVEATALCADDSVSTPMHRLLDDHLEGILFDGLLQGPPDEMEGEGEDDWSLALRAGVSISERMGQLVGEVKDPNWSPYPNKGTLLCDIIMHSKRTRFSQAEQAVLLFLARSLGALQVPTLHAVSAWAQVSLEKLGDPARRLVSMRGNVYYLNSLGHALALDLSNPLKRPTMQFYPVLGTALLQEFWHGLLWTELARDEVLTPMISHHGRHWFVRELVQRRGGEFFIPLRWFELQTCGGPKGAVGWSVAEIAGVLHINMQERVLIMAEDFELTYPELRPLFESQALSWDADSQPLAESMPNPWRERAAGRMVYSIPIMVWTDDVSGNVSKQWNKHICMCMSNLTLPRKQLDREANIHFMGTSTFASPLELMEGLVQMLEGINSVGYEGFDAVSRSPVLFNAWLAILAGDNPLQAELCSHKGLHSNRFCRRCHVGGTGTYKRSQEGYPTLFEVGTPRTARETMNHVRTMLEMAVKTGRPTAVGQYGTDNGIRDGYAEPVIQRLQELGRQLRSQHPQDVAANEKTLYEEAMRLQAPLATNPLMRLNRKLSLHHIEASPQVTADIDPHVATPVELLHTFSLGIWKYLWGALVDQLEAKASSVPDRPALPRSMTPLALLEMRLSSLNEWGWNLPKLNPPYLIQHRKQLVGKHFKALAHCLPFVIEDLVTPQMLEAWVLVGMAAPLLWSYEITDKETYEKELGKTLVALVHAIARVDPVKMISKSKLHIALHTCEDVRLFGPAVLFSTERYESFNTVFRMCSVLSNRQAPSRDIARQFSQFARVEHIAAGGYWRDDESDRWICAGPEVLRTVRAERTLLSLVGQGEEAKVIAHIHMTSAREDTFDSAKYPEMIIPGRSAWPDGHAVKVGKALTAANGDRAPLSAFIIWRETEAGILKTRVGQLNVLLEGGEGPRQDQRALVRQFDVGDPHPRLGCPQLIKTTRMLWLDVKAVLACVNVQHDCSLGGCSGRTMHVEQQEREATSLSTLRVKHRDDDAFLLNTYSLHNQALIRELGIAPFRTPLFSIEPSSFRRALAEQVAKDNKPRQVASGR